MELTESQHRHLAAIITLWEPAHRSPTREQITTQLYGERTNTGNAVTRVINNLEELGAVEVTWSVAENDEVITPTNEGRAAL